MVLQRFEGAQLQVDGAYTQDVIRSFIDKLTVPDVNGFESVRLTLKPCDPKMDRCLEIYAHCFPKVWDEKWAPSEIEDKIPTDVMTFTDDIGREAKRVTDYWEENRREHRDVFRVAGQKRLADATKAYGSSFLIHTDDRRLNAKEIQNRLSKSYIALAKECNEGRLGSDGILEMSMTQYPTHPWTNRVKINTNQPASPELYEGIKKVLREQNLNMSVKVKTSIATYLSCWARESGLPHIPFDSPAETFSNSVDELNNLLTKTSFFG
ncbi:unnamed protein product, partial [Mesorhabditis spiculigera]